MYWWGEEPTELVSNIETLGGRGLNGGTLSSSLKCHDSLYMGLLLYGNIIQGV